MMEYVTVWRDHKPTNLRWAVPVVRCRDCREVRHELPARVGSYERAERWVCARWTGCETLPDAFCSFGKRAGAMSATQRGCAR